MPRGDTRRRAFLTLVLFAIGAPVAFGEGFDPPAEDARVKPILDEWQRRSSKLKSLEVFYTREDKSQPWGKERFSGRVVLSRDGRAIVEVESDKKNPYPVKVQYIWADGAYHVIMDSPESKQPYALQPAEIKRGKLPAMLALPFFWNLTVEGMKSRYRLKLVKEEAETWLISITPLTGLGTPGFSTVFVQLDRTTYLPRRYFVVDPDRQSTKDYRVSKVLCDQPIPEETFKLPGKPPGWEFVWPPKSSWFKLDELP